MKERPILFSGLMVQAILAGRKTQTRRIINFGGSKYGMPNPGLHESLTKTGIFEEKFYGTFDKMCLYKCKFGRPGDRLWVRETWGVGTRTDPFQGWKEGIEYWADEAGSDGVELLPLYEVETPDDVYLSNYEPRWRPSIHLPRWASRIDLEITGIRIERLQDISEKDAIAEGCFTTTYRDGRGVASARLDYHKLWDRINGVDSWPSNPWVWVVEFRRIRP